MFLLKKDLMTEVNILKKDNTIYFYRYYYENDKKLPLFEFLQPYHSMSYRDREKCVDDVFTQIYFNDVPRQKICKIQPRMVQDNASFFVNTECLKDIKDLLADDCGSWRHNGVKQFTYHMNSDQEIEKCTRGSRHRIVATLHRCYYINKSHSKFRKIISFVKG